MPQTPMAYGSPRVAGISMGNEQASRNLLGLVCSQALHHHRMVQFSMSRHLSGPHDLEGKHECPIESPTRSLNTSTSLVALLGSQPVNFPVYSPIDRAGALHLDASANATLSINEWHRIYPRGSFRHKRMHQNSCIEGREILSRIAIYAGKLGP